MDDRALVIGAGIAGLATAIALQRAGRDVLVLERAPQLREIGAGISLWPNAINALRRLGVGDAVEAAGAPARDAAFRSWRGAQLGASITSRLQGRFGAPLVLVHRARLQAVLRRALGPDAVRLGAECAASTRTRTRSPCAWWAAGWSAAPSSSAPMACARACAPRSCTTDRRATRASPPGAASSRSTTRSATASRSGESLGRGSLFGVARLSGSQVYWWAGVRRRESGGDEPRAEKSALLRAFADWHDPIPELVAATPPEAIIRTCLYDRPPLERLSLGRIALAGDAAHPMLPNLGQGACQAIEDAVVLGDELAASDVVAALERYGARRAGHAADVVRASRQMSRIAHLRSPVAAGLRNALLRASPPSAPLRRLEPIVGHVLGGS